MKRIEPMMKKEEAEIKTETAEAATNGCERPALKEGTDYYFEKGLMVFTSHYLLRRGYCCGNDCRHCPYKEISDLKSQI